MSARSTARYAVDNTEARLAVYANPDGVNPFEEGTRKHRLWEKWKRTYDHCESVMEVMHG